MEIGKLEESGAVALDSLLLARHSTCSMQICPPPAQLLL
jgi:hypothetical protein